MPIYAYRCAACGHSRDVLQKLSDAPLSVCPSCGAEQFSKQITAAGFQLKGSGWYATDFRSSGSAPPAAAASGAAGAATPAPAKPSDTGASASAPSSGGTACGGSCACH